MFTLIKAGFSTFCDAFLLYKALPDMEYSLNLILSLFSQESEISGLIEPPLLSNGNFLFLPIC